MRRCSVPLFVKRLNYSSIAHCTQQCGERRGLGARLDLVGVKWFNCCHDREINVQRLELKRALRWTHSTVGISKYNGLLDD